MESIHWPDESKILPYKQKPRVLHQIEKLFYNAGVTVSLLYLALKLVIQPILEQHFDQRIQLSSECLLHLRRFVSLLTKKIKATPISAIGFNEHKIQGTSVCYVERCTQTEEPLGSDASKKTTRWGCVNEKLKSAKQGLVEFNELNDRSDHLDSFSFQTKLVNDLIAQSNTQSGLANTTRDITKNTREMKGWFLNGKIPS